MIRVTIFQPDPTVTNENFICNVKKKHVSLVETKKENNYDSTTHHNIKSIMLTLRTYTSVLLPTKTSASKCTVAIAQAAITGLDSEIDTRSDDATVDSIF